MATPARAEIESLLRARKLDGTLSSAHPLRVDAVSVVGTGVPVLDARLGGGWPRGQVSELVGPRSSGRTWVLVQSLAAATRDGELAALVDGADTFDPASAAGSGIEWPYLLWVRGRTVGHARQVAGVAAASACEAAMDRALKAAALVLQAGGFGLVALDLADMPMPALRRLPFTTWLRLHRLVEGRDTAAVVLAPEPLTRSSQGVSVQLDAAGPVGGAWGGGHDRSRWLTGLNARAHVVRTRWQAGDDRDVFVETNTRTSRAGVGEARSGASARRPCR